MELTKEMIIQIISYIDLKDIKAFIENNHNTIAEDVEKTLINQEKVDELIVQEQENEKEENTNE